MNQYTVIFYTYRPAGGPKMYKWRIKETATNLVIAKSTRAFATMALCQQNMIEFFAWFTQPKAAKNSLHAGT